MMELAVMEFSLKERLQTMITSLRDMLQALKMEGMALTTIYQNTWN